jgi:putative transcriptional regulator
MDSSLRERFARLGPIRAADLVPCGSPAVFVLRLPPGQGVPKTINATLALVKRGMAMLHAKRRIEELLQTGRAFVDVPTVEDPTALAADLAAAGIAAAPVEPSHAVDVRALRERLGLTREQFAIRYGLEVETVRNWEAGRREPDTTARSYLRVISNDPEHVEQAYAPTPPLQPPLTTPLRQRR